jgi:Ca2+-binding RTX toxin-like protein
MSGGSDNDTLNGGAGDDELSGDAGNDLLIGGAGDDNYIILDENDVVQEAAGGGTDTVAAYIDLTLGANLENAYLAVGGLTVTGNDLNNVMTGSIGPDDLSGGKGNDTLFGNVGGDTLAGGDGNDVVDGGLGVDLLTGGAGNDTFRYSLDNPADIATLGGDIISGFEVGKDTIDLYDLFEAFDITSEDPIGEGYLQLQVAAGDTLVRFDSDGGGDSFVTLATLQGITNATLADLIVPQHIPAF